MDNKTYVERDPNLSGVDIYNGFDKAVVEHIAEFKAYFDGPTPQNEKLPGKWDESLNPLQKLGVLRCFRPDEWF